MVNAKKHNVSQKTQLLIATGSVLLLTVLAVLVWWADSNSGWKFVKDSSSYPEVTIKGEPVCLPQRNSNGPQTLECAQGVKTASGSYYAISGVIDRRNQDGSVEVTGTLQPTKANSKYITSGTIQVE